ncbi:MAG TPA: iron-sulfur cluster assembly scaffold protein [candidate division Zixibacteria bacterium]|nr:iron-sulfur cluster assembly scaffold protein [candidate division Zixibacteria bacterium]
MSKDLYSKKVMEHFAEPHNVGEIPDASASGDSGNPICGDMMKFSLKIEDNRIVDIKFKTFGCAAAIASSSVLTDLAKGKTLDEAFAITKQTIIDELEGLPPVKIHCSILGIDALRRAICDFWKKQGKIAEHPDCERIFGGKFAE